KSPRLVLTPFLDQPLNNGFPLSDSRFVDNRLFGGPTLLEDSKRCPLEACEVVGTLRCTQRHWIGLMAGRINLYDLPIKLQRTSVEATPREIHREIAKLVYRAGEVGRRQQGTLDFFLASSFELHGDTQRL